MSLESYTGNIADLVVTNPQPTDPKSQGDDHLRGIKYTLKQTFPGFDGPLNATRVPFTPSGNIAASNVQAALQEVDTTKVSKAGDTMTGNLLIRNGTTERYVTVGSSDAYLYGNSSAMGLHAPTGNVTISVSNDGYCRATNFLLGSQPENGEAATRKDYVDGQVNGRIARSGDTMLGGLTMGEAGQYSHGVNFQTSFGSTGFIRGEHVAGTETKVVIGTDQGQKFWQFKNNGSAYGDAWVDLSDARTKSDIQPITDALAKTLTLRGCTFLRNGREDRSAGLIAQDVHAVLPEAAEIVDHETGYLGLDATGVVGLLVEAVKELSAKLDLAMVEIAELKAR